MALEIKGLLAIFEQLNSGKLQRKSLNHKKLKEFLSKNFAPDQISLVGYSYQKREIYSVKFGYGKTKVLLWSQMHGNEPSSTLSLLKVLDFLKNTNNNISKKILENLQILAIPMLNPDGAVAFTRRNAMQIDINRDARRLTAPESKILQNIAQTFSPHWAFNMHDQEIYYGTKTSPYPTALALLVPSASPESHCEQERFEAMSITGEIANFLHLKINIARYNDSYMPTAFGDWFSSNCIRTILFETGYMLNDNDRQWSTTYNALAVLAGLYFISEAKFSEQNVDFYLDLPFNQKHKFFDIILENVPISSEGQTIFRTDIGISRDRREQEHFTDYDEEYLIFDIGDLSHSYAFKTINCQACPPLDFSNLKLYANINEFLRQIKT